MKVMILDPVVFADFVLLRVHVGYMSNCINNSVT